MIVDHLVEYRAVVVSTEATGNGRIMAIEEVDAEVTEAEVVAAVVGAGAEAVAVEAGAEAEVAVVAVEAAMTGTDEQTGAMTASEIGHHTRTTMVEVPGAVVALTIVLTIERRRQEALAAILPLLPLLLWVGRRGIWAPVQEVTVVRLRQCRHLTLLSLLPLRR